MQKRLGRAFLTVFRILFLLSRTFREKKLTILAQSLAYTTIFALVPILSIFFFVLGKITANNEVQKQIEEFISGYIQPEYVQWIFDTLEGLSTDSLVFGAIGFPALFITGVFLYAKVDSSINAIWMSDKEPKWFKNGLAFFMTIFFGPMILVLVFSIPPYLQNLPFINEVLKNTRLDNVFTQLIPFLILFFGLSVLYLYIPSAPVKLHAAVKGALTAAVIIQSSNFLISIYVKSFAKFDLFFGSLATIPVLLLYVFVFWLVVLIGASLSFVHQYYGDSGYLNQQGMYNNESILSSALMVMVYLSQCFEKRNEAPDFDQIQLMLGLNRKRLSFILDTLKKEKMVTVYEDGNSRRNTVSRYQPGLLPAQIYLRDLLPIFYQPQQHLIFRDSLSHILQLLEIHPVFSGESINIQALLNGADGILEDLNRKYNLPGNGQ
ncbi:MAG: YihY/virulence factor BrkB family protein [bacterium]